MGRTKARHAVVHLFACDRQGVPRKTLPAGARCLGHSLQPACLAAAEAAVAAVVSFRNGGSYAAQKPLRSHQGRPTRLQSH